MSDSIPAEEEAEKKDNTTSQDTPAAEQTSEQPAEENAEQTEQMENAQNEAEASDEVTTPPAPEPVPVATAPRCENPIIGRKVFFVNPPLYVENYLHLELKLHEYEAYIISDYKYFCELFINTKIWNCRRCNGNIYCSFACIFISLFNRKFCDERRF